MDSPLPSPWAHSALSSNLSEPSAVVSAARARRTTWPTRAGMLSVLLCLGAFASPAMGQAPPPAPARPRKSVAPLPPDPPAVPQEQFLPYWTTEAGWHTEIQLRNNRNSGDLSVTPVLRSADGTETSLSPVVVKPQEVKTVDVMDAIQGLAPQLNGAFGSVVLRYSAASIGNLFAMGMIHGVGHPFAFHIDPSAQQPDSEAGGREGIWWLPRESTSDLLILTNQGRDPMNLTVSLYDEGGKEFRQNIVLGPAATARYSVRKWVAAAGFTGTYGGVRVRPAAHTGSLDTLHFLFDESAGFSALLKMFEHQPNAPIAERDFAKTGVWTQHAPMVALSTPDPALAFPPSTVLQPQLFIRNTIGKPSDVKLRFNWRRGTDSGGAPGPVLHLAPSETRRVDMAALQDGKTLPKDANWASVTLTANGNPDEVMAVAASFDASLQHGAQTPFSDQLASTWKGSVWEYDANHDSLITIGNGAAKPTRAAFTIFYNQGTQRYDLEQALQPDEQMWIDVGQLIREHVPDKNGKVLPVDLTSGTYEFRDLMNPHNGTLYEGKVVYDKTYGHAAYGCAYCCGYTLVDLFYDPIDLPILTGADDGVLAENNCTGAYDDVSDSFYANWTSGNTSMVTVDYYGTHTGRGVGSTTSATHGYLAGVSPPRCPSKYHSAGGGVNVMPQIDSISPTRGPIGLTVSVTINGTGFGTSPTVDAGTGITVTVNSANDSQIQASFNISSSATPGDHSVTVTANGETSDSVTFFAQVPTSLSVLPSTGVIDTSYLGGTCTDSSYGIAIAVYYQVQDQAGNPVANNQLEPQELVGIWKDIGPSSYPGTSKYTDANGQFIDAPVGACNNVQFTATLNQPIAILIGTNRYSVRTNTWTISSSSAGHGSITNSQDVSKSR